MDINLKEVDTSILMKKYGDFVKKYSDYTELNYSKSEVTKDQLVKEIFFIHNTNFETFKVIHNLIIENHIYDALSLIRPLYESVLNLGLLVSDTIAGGVERYSEFGWIKIYDYYRCFGSIYNIKIEIPKECLDRITAYYKEYYPEKLDDWIKKNTTKDSNWSGMKARQICQKLDSIYPTKYDKVFFQRRYCEIFNLISNVVHRNVTGFEVTYLPKINGEYIEPVNNIDMIRIGIRESLLVYLNDLRFVNKVYQKVENSEKNYDEEIMNIVKIFGY